MRTPGTSPPSTTRVDGDTAPTVIDGVAVVHWPTEAETRTSRARDQQPRVLVIADDEPPPLVWDDIEDWVRASAGTAEVAARTARLATRSPSPSADAASPASSAAAGWATPVLDADGIVRVADGRWTSIPPVEARLLAPLLDRPGHVAHRADLLAAAWPQGGVNQRALDGRMKLLRRRVAPLGIRIHTVRGLGFLLEVSAG